MRQLVESIKDRELLLIDGVKVLDDVGWVLILPDPQEPVTHVWAEDATEARARSKAQEYAVRLRQMLQ
jgi:mannose-1-phosphate guanylyltransferase/phosphomannomutase